MIGLTPMLLAATPLLPFTLQGSGCNDQDRELSTQGGDVTTSSVPCAQITLTFTILGNSVTLSTPESCPSGRRAQDSDCFTCGEPSPGNNCLSNQFSVNVKIYSSGDQNPCPMGPSSIPETVREFTESMSCVPPPLLNEEEVGCSRARPCGLVPEEIEPYSHALVTPSTSLAGAFRREWRGPLQGTLPGPAANPWRDFLTSLPRSQAQDLPAPLNSIVAGSAPLAGVSGLSARIELEYHRDGGDPLLDAYSVHGTVLADGSFSLIVPRRASAEGTARDVVEELAYDGATLVSEILGAETYQAYASSYPQTRYVLSTQTGFFRTLRVWAGNPFDLPRLAGTVYTVEPISPSEVRVTETYPVPDFPAWAGSLVHTIDIVPGGSRLPRSEARAAGGEVLRTREYGSYRLVQSGVWRPTSITEVVYPGGSASISALVVRTTIEAVGTVHGDPQAAQSAFEMPMPSSGWWIVHE